MLIMDFVVKKMKTIGTIFQFPTVTRRVFILVAVFLCGIGSVWGQVSFSTNAVTKEFYLNKGSQNSVDVDITSKISQICSDLSTVAGTTITPSSLSSNYVLLWGLGDESGNVVTSTSTVKAGTANNAASNLFYIKSTFANAWESGNMKPYDNNGFSFISYNNCQGEFY